MLNLLKAMLFNNQKTSKLLNYRQVCKIYKSTIKKEVMTKKKKKNEINSIKAKLIKKFDLIKFLYIYKFC